jgi:hypothetical protein
LAKVLSILGANSLLNSAPTDSFQLYAGVPARPTKELDVNLKYFTRTEGFVS